MAQARPCRGQRESHIGQRDRRLVVEVREQTFRLSTKTRLRPSGKDERARAPLRAGALSGIGPRANHDVAIGATDTERADTGDQRTLPWSEFPLHADVQVVERDLRVRRLEVQARRDLAAVQRQYDLEQAGDARGTFEVTDIGLDRAHSERLTRAAQHRAQGCGLDGVTDLRARAVQLDVANLGGVDARALIRPRDDSRLRRRTRRRQRLAATIVVDRASGDHRVHGVAVGQRGRQRLQHDQTAALTPDETVGARVEREAAPVRRQAAELRHHPRALRREVQVHAAGDRCRRLTRAQTLTGQVHRDQRRGLPGVHGHAGAVHAERVRHAVGDDAPVQPGQALVADRALSVGQGRVVVPDGADEHAEVAVPLRERHHAGVFERFPGQFEHQALLRVGRRRLTR